MAHTVQILLSKLTYATHSGSDRVKKIILLTRCQKRRTFIDVLDILILEITNSTTKNILTTSITIAKKKKKKNWLLPNKK